MIGTLAALSGAKSIFLRSTWVVAWKYSFLEFDYEANAYHIETQAVGWWEKALFSISEDERLEWDQAPMRLSP